MIRFVAAGLLLCVAGCARRNDVPSPDQSSAPAGGPAISLERTACFGSCPIYSIAVSPTGEVTFEGKAHVRQLGTALARIPRERVEALLSELDRAGYFTFADRYTSAEPTCGRYSTDSPSVVSSATRRGRTKRIEHDYGCGAAPKALTVLERRIDEVLDSRRWTGR